MAKALAPGLDAKSVAAELRSASSRSSTTRSRPPTSARSPAPTAATRSSSCPTSITALSTERVLVTEWIDGVGFDEVKKLPAGGARPLRRDRLPLLLRLRLPPAALQRRRPPGQLPADGRRQGRVPGLRHDQAPGDRADRAGDRGHRGRDLRTTRSACSMPSTRSATCATPRSIDPEKLMRHVMAVGGWYMVDEDLTINADTVMTAIGRDDRPALGVLRPRSPAVAAGRRADGPAHADRRPRRPRAAQRDAQLDAHRPGSGGSPTSPRPSWASPSGTYFEAKGEKRVRKFALRNA